MTIDHTAFNQIATTLARHFETLYYIEIESGNYSKFGPSDLFKDVTTVNRGKDFFAQAINYAHIFAHPNDLKSVLKFHDRCAVLENLSHKDFCSLSCRLVSDSEIIHIRQIYMRCEDNKHIICGIENIENEYHEKEEQKKNLQSAERMARLDELTGIKNKNAFKEYCDSLDQKLRSEDTDITFGIVMCDMNDLKLLNDTRGHSFGDEALRRTSRIICDIFRHSPVFRIGGDEFAVVLTGCDYKHRDCLLQNLRNESETNARLRSGPVIASGMAVYSPDSDQEVMQVFKRADSLMYENKSELKSKKYLESFSKTERLNTPITDERRRRLDGLFGALYTMSGDGYVFLNDMKYDYSRWSIPLVDDFGLESEYMYNAGNIWHEYIHPDDINVYSEAVKAALCGNAEIRPILYRARKTDGSYVQLSTRAFVLFDIEGNPEYFGGLIIPKGCCR